MRHFSNKFWMFAAFLAIGLLVYRNIITKLGLLSFENNLYSHFFLIPGISIYFFVINRKTIFSDSIYIPRWGFLFFLLSILTYLLAFIFKDEISPNDYLSLCMTGFIIWIIGSFITVFGVGTFRRGLFPILFLLFMIPIPSFILNSLVLVLQVSSAEAVQIIFQVIGIPFIREGMVFELPGISIEVAKQCGGIRSSIALLITSVIVGYIFFNSVWRRVALIFFVLPLTIFKNAIRISVLTVLSVYIDKAWLTNSWLHHSGGVVFFIMALLILTLPVWLLYSGERASSTKLRAPQ